MYEIRRKCGTSQWAEIWFRLKYTHTHNQKKSDMVKSALKIITASRHNLRNVSYIKGWKNNGNPMQLSYNR